MVVPAVTIFVKRSCEREMSVTDSKSRLLREVQKGGSAYDR